MKKGKKLALCAMIGIFLTLPNEVNAAETVSNDTVKKVILIISLIVIFLLLYFGYRMDTNESRPKEKKSKKKDYVDSKSNYIKKQDFPGDNTVDNIYEEDSGEYEEDDVNPSEISENVEYEEDEDVYQLDNLEEISNVEPEETLYEASNNDFGETMNFDINALKKEMIKDEPIKDEFILEDEELGEEFDTSIIDLIDEEFEEVDSASAFTTGKVELNKQPIELEETEFEGFSVRESNVKKEDFKEIDNFEDIEDINEINHENKTEEKTVKRYTKASKNTKISTELEDDFMRQMEANLEEGNGENIKSSKGTTKKKKTK